MQIKNAHSFGSSAHGKLPSCQEVTLFQEMGYDYEMSLALTIK